MLGNTWNLLSPGNKGWEPHWIYPKGKREPCSRWHGRWQPQNWNPETVTSNRASCHYVTIKWGGKERQMSSCPFPCFFTETDEFQQIPPWQLLTVNTLSNPFTPFVSKNTEFQRPSWFILTKVSPHGRFKSVCRCRKGGKDSCKLQPIS